MSTVSTPLLPCATTPQPYGDDVKIPPSLQQIAIGKGQNRTTIASILGFWLGINADVVLDLFFSIVEDLGAWPAACIIEAAVAILVFVLYRSTSSPLHAEKQPLQQQTSIKIDEPNL
jgi:hypothetical protein